MPLTKKIRRIEKLVCTINGHRKNGKQIVHCHGVFDLLHIGHIKYFNEAKSFGDILVVTITPDRYVNKGPNRPVFNELLRAEAISALEIVDYVIINEWPTAIEAIKIIKPDFYVKGPDYKNMDEDITGNISLEEQAVNSIGGQLAFTTGDIFSSSTILNQELSVLNEKQKKYIEQLKKKYTIVEIIKFVDRLQKLKILLIGETIIDKYIFCDSIGKSGKEPVLITKKGITEEYAGGILAIANNVADFCHNGYIYSLLGEKEEYKDFITKNLENNITYNYITKTESPTIVKTRYLDNYTNTKVFGVYEINDSPLELHNEKDYCKKLVELLPHFDLVIVADYGHGMITEKTVKIIEENSNFLAINTQLNSFNLGFHSISKYNKADYVCVHEGELRHDYRNRSDSVESLIKDLSKKLNTDRITITRGTKGSIGYNKEEFIECPALSGKIIDRIGAGDSLYALTSMCFAADIPADITLFLGNIAASYKLTYHGNKHKIKKVDLIKAITAIFK